MELLLKMVVGAIIGLGFAALVIRAQNAEVNKIGPIRCRRCGYLGKALLEKQRNKGIVFLCPKCRGDDWTRADDIN